MALDRQRIERKDFRLSALIDAGDTGGNRVTGGSQANGGAAQSPAPPGGDDEDARLI